MCFNVFFISTMNYELQAQKEEMLHVLKAGIAMLNGASPASSTC